MNRATRELIKKQRQKSGFIGFKTGGKAGTTRGGLFSNLFKRKKMQPPTPSGETQKKTTTTKPSATKTTTTKPSATKTKPETTKTQPETTVTKPQGRAAQMMKSAAGNPNKPSVDTSQRQAKIKKEIVKLERIIGRSTTSSTQKISLERKLKKLREQLKDA